MRPLRSGRPACAWLSPSQRLRWGDAVRAQLTKTPGATVAELAAATGAPPEFARKVRELARRRESA